MSFDKVQNDNVATTSDDVFVSRNLTDFVVSPFDQNVGGDRLYESSWRVL